MDFVVIDVETANPDLASICQVGITVFSSGQFSESWSTLVNPNDYFDSHNVSVHGINEEMVASAPHWIEVHDRLRANFSNQILASHTPFDRTAIRRACEKSSFAVWLWACKCCRSLRHKLQASRCRRGCACCG